MRVTFCGTRGSTPSPGSDFVRYGGHTSCIALAHDDRSSIPTLLLDAGTGIRRLPELLGNRPFEGTVLLTHLHWDHVQGLPFFASGDREDARVTLLLPDQDPATEERASAEQLLARMMSPPFFPIGPLQLRGTWRFGLVPSPPFDAEGFHVTALEIPHKSGRTLGFRVSDGHAVVAYLPDHCPTALGDGPDGVGEYHEAAVELARDADLLVHDAHLRAEEVAAEGFFGHAAAEYAVALGVKAGVRRVALFHHRPERDDRAVDLTVRRFADGPVPVVGAAEGTTLSL